MPRFKVTAGDEEFTVDAVDEAAAQRGVQAQLDKEDGQPSRDEVEAFANTLHRPLVDHEPEPQGRSGVAGLLLGAGKSLAESGTGALELLQKLVPGGAYADPGARGDAVEGLDQQRGQMERHGTAEKVGAFGEQVAEFAVPGALAEAGIAKLPSFLARQGARGALGGAQELARSGGDPTAAGGAAVLGGLGGAAGEGFQKLGQIMGRSALKNALNFIQPQSAADREAAGELAQRFIDEGLMRDAQGGSGAAAKKADELRKHAYAEIEAYLVEHGDEAVDAKPVLTAARGTGAPALPDGSARVISGAKKLDKASKAITADTENFVRQSQTTSGPGPRVGGDEVPLSAAVSEKQALDEMIWKGRNKPARSDAAVQTVADSLRGQINSHGGPLPRQPGVPSEIGGMNERYSELRKLADLLGTAEKLSVLPQGSSQQASGAVGAGAAGHYTIPAMRGMGWLVRQPEFQSMSGRLKLLASQLAQDKTARTQFIAAMAQAAIPETIPSH